MLDGFHPKRFERAFLGYHCCTVHLKQPSEAIPSIQTLFRARFYDSTLTSFLDSFKAIDPSSVLAARAATWGTLISNDVFDYVSDGISSRAANLCWAIGCRDSPVECARMFPRLRTCCSVTFSLCSWGTLRSSLYGVCLSIYSTILLLHCLVQRGTSV